MFRNIFTVPAVVKERFSKNIRIHFKRVQNGETQRALNRKKKDRGNGRLIFSRFLALQGFARRYCDGQGISTLRIFAA